MIDTIHEAKKIKVLIESLKNRKQTLSVPELTDQAHIPVLYRWFNEIEGERDCPPHFESVYLRKKFCFIILRLYSPGTILFGDLMVTGLRETLSQLLDVKSASSVSDYCTDIIFMYKNYKETRDAVNLGYERIIERIGKLGRIPEK